MMGHLNKLLAPTAEALGYDLVRVSLLGSGRPTLQVMAERLDETPMTVSDCEALSRALSAVLDVEDPIAGAYMLEVSSPGIDRPLTRPKDFARFAGRDVRIETDRLVDGYKRIKGVLLGIDNDRTVKVQLAEPSRLADGQPGSDVLAIPFGAITKARLLLTDALIAESLREAARRAEAETLPEEDDAVADEAVEEPGR
ncbi:Ribosome maturation factor rimP [Pararhodospirillum photometricum DSM 122]|uniref:Ribosome maturation factor RimP n=2 Tax=Pararhodospirillum photometricum TaxID=1084 RepID=H6SRP2_PARPM|nr:Ribosome maturation factor rimP [Pararhodospirillum photometricum DSM 122]